MGPSSHEPEPSTRIAWFHCHAGVAGDMVLGALVDAGADPEAIVNALDGLGVDGWALTFETVQRAGLRATHAVVAVHDASRHDGADRAVGDLAHHHHPHGITQAAATHRPYAEIRELLARADLPERVRDRAQAVFALLAGVESRIHGCHVDEVEFHEVGSLDAILDIVGVCAALEDLGVERVVVSPITVGHGTVATAHGPLPHPVPAVLELAAHAGLKLTGVDEPLELATPTGIALMAALAEACGPMPPLGVEAVGHGAGTRDTVARPNLVQVVIGTPTEPSAFSRPGRPAVEIAANVDDVTPEVLAHTVARLLEAGAHDAWITPIVMKKGRPAHTVYALGSPETAETLMTLLVAETGTMGLRAREVERWPQRREETTVDVEGHPVRVKRSGDRLKAEFDDAMRVASVLGLPVREVLRRAERPAP